MIILESTPRQRIMVQNVLGVHPSSGRGDFDGAYYKQFFGLLAQVVVAEYLGVPYSLNTSGFDGGYDLVWNGKLWDVKCECRTVKFNPRIFVHNLSGFQKGYCAEGYIFVSYNCSSGEFTLCGFIEKEHFFAVASFYPVGSSRVRDDGSVMYIRGSKGMYELSDKYLKKFKE